MNLHPTPSNSELAELREAAAESKLSELEALLEQEMASAKERHDAKLLEMERREEAAAARLEEVEMMLETLSDEQKRLDLMAVEKQLKEKRAAMEALGTQWDSLRASSVQAEQAAEKLTASLSDRAEALQLSIRQMEADLAAKSSDLSALESRLKAQEESYQAASQRPAPVTSPAPVSAAEESVESITPMLDLLDLVDRAYAALHGPAASTEQTRASLQLLRNAVALQLSDRNVYEFAIRPCAPLDDSLQGRVTVQERRGGDGREIILQTVSPGVQFEPTDGPPVCLRPAVVITGSAA